MLVELRSLTGDAAQILTHVVVGAGNTAVLAALLLSQPHLLAADAHPYRRRWRRPAALAAGSLASVALLGAAPAVVAATLGSVIGLVGAAAALLQPLRLVLDPGRDLSGLSPTRWQLGAGSCAMWTTYGLLIAQPMVSLSAGFGLGCAVVMCAAPPGPFAAVRRRAPELRPAMASATARLAGATSAPLPCGRSPPPDRPRRRRVLSGGSRVGAVRSRPEPAPAGRPPGEEGRPGEEADEVEVPARRSRRATASTRGARSARKEAATATSPASPATTKPPAWTAAGHDRTQDASEAGSPSGRSSGKPAATRPTPQAPSATARMPRGVPPRARSARPPSTRTPRSAAIRPGAEPGCSARNAVMVERLHPQARRTAGGRR